MDPKTAARLGAEELPEELYLDSQHLSELDIEDLIGHHVELDERDDWPALDL